MEWKEGKGGVSTDIPRACSRPVHRERISRSNWLSHCRLIFQVTIPGGGSGSVRHANSSCRSSQYTRQTLLVPLASLRSRLGRTIKVAYKCMALYKSQTPDLHDFRLSPLEQVRLQTEKHQDVTAVTEVSSTLAPSCEVVGSASVSAGAGPPSRNEGYPFASSLSTSMRDTVVLCSLGSLLACFFNHFSYFLVHATIALRVAKDSPRVSSARILHLFCIARSVIVDNL